MGRWSEALSGAGLGLLVGVLMGLSTASVVGGVVAALAAALAAFFGLVPNIVAGQSVRIGSFGIACTFAVVMGLAIRTGAMGLSPSVQSDVEAWLRAGYPAEEARGLVAYQRLGVLPPSRTVGAAPKVTAGSPVLFSTASDVCSRIARLPPAEVLRTMKDPELGAIVLAAAAAIEAVPKAQQTAAINAYTLSMCGS